MEDKTKELYRNLLSKKKTVKGDADEMIEFVTTSEDLAELKDQTGGGFMSVYDSDKYHKSIDKNGMKVIVRLFDKKITKAASDMLYWACCDFFDMLALGGCIKGSYSSEEDRYETVFIKKESLVSFYGRDIKFAYKNIPEDQMNPILKRFGDEYINKDHPLSDNIFYTLYIKNAKGNTVIANQFICCARNADLSPRPVKKQEAPPAETN